MKVLIYSLAAVFFTITAKAGLCLDWNTPKVSFEIPQAEVEKTRREAEEKRERWVRLRKNGGTIYASKPVYGCKDINDYRQLMAYIRGAGTEPDNDACWTLDIHTQVLLTDDPECYSSKEICKFRLAGLRGSFSKKFFTSTHAVRPN